MKLVVDVRPDVVLMDLRLPGLSGVQAIEQVGRLAPASRVLVLTRSEHNRVVEAIVAGASGYILKSAPSEAIISAVQPPQQAKPCSPRRSPGSSCNASAS